MSLLFTSPRVRELARRVVPPATLLRPAPGPIESVVLRVGDDEASVAIKVCVDERVKIRFGTGQEFSGSYRDLPSAIGVAAREVLRAASKLQASPPPTLAELNPRKARTVRISIASQDSVWLSELSMSDFRADSERYAPIWNAVGRLYRPLVNSFFPTSQGRNPESYIPGLTRCRRLWG